MARRLPVRQVGGIGNRYRIRQGDYRMVYSVDDARAEVIVFKVGHRRDVCR
jgi:mRNA interferase RelE/StbE